MELCANPMFWSILGWRKFGLKFTQTARDNIASTFKYHEQPKVRGEGKKKKDHL
jgi:hypothetical protein